GRGPTRVHRPQNWKEGKKMSRVVLLLNALILVVNFLVALSTSDLQLRVLDSSVSLPVPRMVRVVHSAGSQNAALAYFQIVQSLDRFASREQIDDFTTEQIEHYVSEVERGVEQNLNRSTTGPERRRDYEALAKGARSGLEQELGSHFRDSQLISRLATEIIRQAG
ncbi:MAG: hypothetical protein ACE5JG_11810, partial [Planctomycetota bacterium]